MKKWTTVVWLLGSAACGLLRFEVEQEAQTEVAGAGALGGLLQTLDLGDLDDFDLSVEQELADQGVEPGDLRSVVLTEFVLTGDPDLGFLRGLDVFVSAEGIPPFLVATTGPVAPGTTEVALTLPEADLADAVSAGGLRFRIDASGDAPEDDTLVTARVVAEVEATPQGACNAVSAEE